jgi:branched-chain amino acid transport system permease protein
MNFAQGEFLMVGGFVAVSLSLVTGAPFIVVMVGTVAISALLGLVFDRVIYRPMQGGDSATHMIATLAAAIIMRNLAQHIWGPDARSYYDPFNRQVLRIGDIVINPQYLLIIISTLTLLAGLYFLLFKTRVGQMMRATSQDRSTARLIGVKVGHIGTLTFAMAAAFGGLAGILVAPLFLVDLNVGFLAVLKAFIATIIGGWGSIPGAVLGGIMVGLIEVFATHFVSASYKDTVAFGVLMIFLVCRPSGLFSEKIGEKA